MGLSRRGHRCGMALFTTTIGFAGRGARRQSASFGAEAAPWRRAGLVREPALVRRPGLSRGAARARGSGSRRQRPAGSARTDSRPARLRHCAGDQSACQGQQSEGSQPREHVARGAPRMDRAGRQRYAGRSLLPVGRHRAARPPRNRPRDLRLQRSRRPAGLWSQLAAMQINFSFLPGAVVGDAINVGGGCFGATIALRRDVLDRIGGFARLRDELADDHRIGDAVRPRAQDRPVAVRRRKSGHARPRSPVCGGMSCAGRAPAPDGAGRALPVR